MACCRCRKRLSKQRYEAAVRATSHTDFFHRSSCTELVVSIAVKNECVEVNWFCDPNISRAQIESFCPKHNTCISLLTPFLTTLEQLSEKQLREHFPTVPHLHHSESLVVLCYPFYTFCTANQWSSECPCTVLIWRFLLSFKKIERQSYSTDC